VNKIAIKIMTVDIEHPLPAIKASQEYAKVLLLLRLHEEPIGVLELAIPPNGVDVEALAEQVWDTFAPQIRAHLAEDDILIQESLGAQEIPEIEVPVCLQKKQAALEKAPFVSIAIATRDRVESLRECLASVLELDYPNFEVVIVDNAPSSDETRIFIEANFSENRNIRYFRENVPGLAIAHNRALVEINSSIVAFTDDDVLVDKNWLKHIVLNFQRDSEVVCVTGMILPYELETLPQLWIEQFGRFGKGCSRKIFDNYENIPDDFLFPYTAGQFGSGANMAFRVDALKAMGGFDPALGAGTIAKGGDDLASFFDVVSSGKRLVYEPASVLYHKHRRDYPSLARQAYGYGMGLSAFLMKVIVDKPERFLEILIKTPAGLKRILDPSSSKNNNKRVDYPADLTRKELLGFLFGPFAYMWSRWHLRSLKEKLPKVA
jgi:glycosyltransferase involved in cell wall biosynthesis